MKYIIFIVLLSIFIFVMAILPRPGTLERYEEQASGSGSANDWGGAPQAPPTADDMKKCQDKVSELMDRITKKDLDCMKSKNAEIQQQQQISADSNKDQQSRAQLAEQAMRDANDKQKKGEAEVSQANNKFNDCNGKLIQIEPDLTKCKEDFRKERDKTERLTKQLQDITVERDKAQGALREAQAKLTETAGNYENCQAAMRRCEQNMRRY